MANQVNLTFAGDASKLNAAFDSAGRGADAFADKAKVSGSQAADAFDRAGSSASQMSGGVGDVGGALTAAFGDTSAVGAFGAKMETVAPIIMGVTGAMDLANLATAKLRIGAAAAAVQQWVTAGATKAWAAAQWIMNAALLASPITWIVIAIAALIAIIVIIALKTDWFSRAWRASWKWIKDAAANTWNWLKQVPGWIADKFRTVADAVSAPFRAAFNFIADAWNGTIGKLSWSVPAWIPMIGGNTISVPQLPKFHAGGIVPGVPGTPTVAVLQAGERVGSMASRGGDQLVIGSDGSGVGDALVDLIAKTVRRRGGDPTVFGAAT